MFFVFRQAVDKNKVIGIFKISRCTICQNCTNWWGYFKDMGI